MTTAQYTEFSEMCGASNSYHSAAVFLQDMSPIVTKLAKGKLPVDFNSNLISAHILYALSAEIGMKAIMFYEGKPLKRYHNLLEIFNDLEEEHKSQIKGGCEAYKDTFDELLENDKNSFVEWRYFYEGGSKTANISFLRQFSHSVCNLMSELHKEAKVNAV